MNILIVGGLSHLGTNFILSHGDEFNKIVLIDKVSYCSQSKEIIEGRVSKCIWLDANVVDLEAVIVFHGIQLILNLAASTHVDKSYSDFSTFSNDNINLVTHIMETIKRLKELKYIVKLIHVSTDEVYGDNYIDSDNSNRTESDLLSPTNPYSATKAAGDMIINSYCYSYNFWPDVLVLRPNNLAGPFQFPDKIIPLFYNRIRNGDPVHIHGDGQQKRCFVSTSLVCDIISILIKNRKQWPAESKNVFYNIGYNSQAGITVLDIYKIVEQLVNPSDPPGYIFSKDRPYNDRLYRVCNKKIANLLASFNLDHRNINIVLHKLNHTSADAIKHAINQIEYLYPAEQ